MHFKFICDTFIQEGATYYNDNWPDGRDCGLIFLSKLSYARLRDDICLSLIITVASHINPTDLGMGAN